MHDACRVRELKIYSDWHQSAIAESQGHALMRLEEGNALRISRLRRAGSVVGWLGNFSFTSLSPVRTCKGSECRVEQNPACLDCNDSLVELPKQAHLRLLGSINTTAYSL